MGFAFLRLDSRFDFHNETPKDTKERADYLESTKGYVLWECRYFERIERPSAYFEFSTEWQELPYRLEGPCFELLLPKYFPEKNQFVVCYSCLQLSIKAAEEKETKCHICRGPVDQPKSPEEYFEKVARSDPWIVRGAGLCPGVNKRIQKKD
ncbi:hypothetical protein GLAREA_02287 [Glarea lozoyensis ATCC 20868]|uniref:Uncharacterized protein n=1 Tax=Glarea lozoyensis (strain ATCC 20868 / MF5171) TaxID=1116229 RepID=S3CKU7_GLAL2|nr:uncharacterized protein GLAREA_02287 [Glarea lozoyensis ATCC 20868]EPE26375.1 hypothetical protein GLAREA_02287 [Glarea lozoyensis ATCC 20868]